jgi:hypothetical protein
MLHLHAIQRPISEQQMLVLMGFHMAHPDFTVRINTEGLTEYRRVAPGYDWHPIPDSFGYANRVQRTRDRRGALAEGYINEHRQWVLEQLELNR